MNVLTDHLPNSVLISGEEYPINTDFRTSVRYELMLCEKDMEDTDRVIRGLQLYYPVIPTDIKEAVYAMTDFYLCGEVSNYDQSQQGRPTARIYSFEHDALRIYTSFLQAYNIDLTKTDMHWHLFRALFRALPEDTEMGRIMGYRSIRINSKMSKGQKEFYRKMKRLYALPREKHEREFHLDTDEGNAAGCGPNTVAEILD